MWLFNPDEQERYEKLMLKLDKGNVTLSYSSLCKFAKSPRHFIQYKCQDRKTTQANIEGSALDCLLLEGDEMYHEKFIVFESVASSASERKFVNLVSKGISTVEAYKSSYSTKGSSDKRIRKDAASKLNKLRCEIRDSKAIGERTVISQETDIKIKFLAKVLFSSKPVMRLLDQIGEPQKKIEWSYMNWGFVGYIDGFGDIILDLKKRALMTPRKAINEIIYNDMGLQAQMYLHGSKSIDKKPFFFIFIDDIGHHCIIEVHKSVLDRYEERYRKLMLKFNRCFMNGDWASSYDYTANYNNGAYVAFIREAGAMTTDLKMNSNGVYVATV